jgi:integrase
MLEMKPFFVAALETGLRRGDLLSLRWNSIRRP